jgi:hypothetical protein
MTPPKPLIDDGDWVKDGIPRWDRGMQFLIDNPTPQSEINLQVQKWIRDHEKKHEA